MIYAALVAVLIALTPGAAVAQTKTIPTTTTTLPQSAGVPGVLKQPVTSSTTSSVTASPDVIVSGTVSGAGYLGPVPLSGRGGAAFQIGTPYNATLTPYVSYDGGLTYTITQFIDTPTGALIPSLFNFSGFGGPSFSGAIFLHGGATHVKVLVGSYVSGTPTYSLSATAVQDAVRVTPQGANTVIFGGSSYGPGTTGFPLPVQSPLRLGGTPFTLRSTSAAFTPVVVTATQPPHPVMTFNGYISGATVNHYVIDAVTIRVLAPATTATTTMGRVVKRRILYASTQTAAPAAGAVPTCAALAYNSAGNAGGSYTYKYVAVDIWGNEGNLSAASATCSPAANNGETVTLAAVPAGAAGYNVYRTKTGPGATYFFLGRTNTTTFRDITPDSSLTLTQGSINAWGTLPNIDAANAPMELVMEKFVALGTAPTIVSTKTFPATLANNRVVTIAPGTGVGRYRIPGEVEAKAFLAAPTITTALARDIDGDYSVGGSSQINAAFGDIAVNSFNSSDATMGGTFVVWGHELVGITDAAGFLAYNGVALANASGAEGTVLTMKWVAPPVFAVGDEIAIEFGNAATATASTVVEVMVSGRYF